MNYKKHQTKYHHLIWQLKNKTMKAWPQYFNLDIPKAQK